MKSILDRLCEIPPRKIPEVTAAIRTSLFLEHVVARHGHSIQSVARNTPVFNELIRPYVTTVLTEQQVETLLLQLEPFEIAVAEVR